MQHPKHRRYRLQSVADNYCWVFDLINETEHRCFILDHQVGDEFYLFEKSVNIYNNNIRFEYSVLNLYEEGKTYKFEIISKDNEKIVVSNHRGLHYHLPLSFLEHEDDDEIDLEIYKIDLDRNRLKFTNKSFDTNESNFDFSTDYSPFEEKKVYTLPVVKTYINKNNHRFAILNYKANNYHIHIPHIIDHIDLDDELPVSLGYYKRNTNVSLRLTRYYVVTHIFEEGKKYHFEITQQLHNSETGVSYWALRDAHGMYNHYYPENDLTFSSDMNQLNVGDSVELYVLKISNRGYLDLVCEILEWNQSNYDVKAVFEAIGYAQQEETYFFNLGIDDDDDDDLSEEQERSYISQYTDGENLWVFSYLTVLDHQIFAKLNEGEYEEAKTLIDIYIKMERWILEGSDYLRNFSSFKREDIIQKAEHKIEQLSERRQAIDLYLEDKDQEFLRDVKAKLSLSPYLNKKTRALLKALVNISQYFSADSEDDNLYSAVMLLLKHGFISDDERWVYIQSVESKIWRVRDKVLDENIPVNPEDNKGDLKLLIRNQYLLIIFSVLDQNFYKASISSVNLLRCLTIFYNDKAYLDLAIQMIAKQGFINPNVLKHDNILALDIDAIKEISIYNSQEESFYLRAGIAYYQNSGLHFIPKNLMGQLNDDHTANTIAQLEDFDLYIESCFETDQIQEEDDVNTALVPISKALNFRKSDSLEPTAQLFNQTFSGRIKSVGKHETYCYLRTFVEGSYIDTLLHVNSFHQIKVFLNIADYIRKNDRINFYITGIEDERIHISPERILEDYATKRLQKRRNTIGKVVRVYKNRVYLITEEGLPVFIQSKLYREGDVLDLHISGYNYDFHDYEVDNFALSGSIFKGNLKQLFRQYLITAGLLEEPRRIKGLPAQLDDDVLDLITGINTLGIANQEIHFDESIRGRSLLLMNCLEQRLNYLSDSKDLALHYFFIINIAGIAKSSKSYLYNTKLNNLGAVIKLQVTGDFELLETLAIQQEEQADSSELKADALAFSMLEFVNLNNEYLEVPINIGQNSRFYRLKKLIESHNLLAPLDTRKRSSTYIKKLIINEFCSLILKKDVNFSKEFEAVLFDHKEEEPVKKKPVTNLGSESKTKEFKSSFFYSASDTPQQDVILRTIAGFLNAYDGGSLFIGVNDAGEIIGLKEDLNYTSNITSLDQYQNHIQSTLVAAFPKEINALLDFKFLRSGNKNYLEIVIPAYDKPVPFKNEFFQRQGVQTRILKGTDIVDFISRKAQAQYSSPAERVEAKENATKPTSIGIAAQPHQKSTHSSANISEEDLLANLYIFEDNTYMLSLQELDSPYLVKLPIPESFKSGHVLLCYDNACINKVEMRSLLNRSFNKHYMNALSDYGQLIKAYTAKQDSDLIVLVKKDLKTYLKIYDVNEISEHRIIGLKGNCIVQDDFDEIVEMQYSDRLPTTFDTFRSKYRKGLGTEINPDNLLFKELMARLKQHRVHLTDDTLS